MEFSDLEGLTLTEIEGLEEGSEEVHFKTECGRRFRMLHSQDCCEQVEIEDVCGDVNDILDLQILSAEEVSSEDEDEHGVKGRGYDSVTWTFYHIRTVWGTVTIRWCGESNGYYSEDVSFYEVKRGR